jgi:transcriptional regulator with XRE-family HTH domain
VGNSAAAGMMRTALARILSGKFDPKLSTIERLAAALGVEASRLLR